jgi:hypothetical protein
MKRIAQIVFLTVFTGALPAESVEAVAPSIIGDYNDDGIVSHADYSVLGDRFGQSITLPGDPTPGTVTAADFAIYIQQYGKISSLPGILPFAVTAAETVGGNREWLMQFSGVNGALAGHLNISVAGSTILSVAGGPAFLDDGVGALSAPGLNASLAIEQGISFSGATAFAALGTTLTPPPSLLNSNSTLEFLRIVTAGTQWTKLSFDGEYGYLGLDYINSGSLTVVPEPSILAVIAIGWMAAACWRRSKS